MISAKVTAALMSPSSLGRADVELSARRARHPLHIAFRAVDARDYSEIATTEADGRAVLRFVA